MKTDLGQSDRAVAINPEAVIEERYAFMDGVHFQHHLGTDGQAAPLYASVADVLKYEPCAAECGVVKVKVVAMSWPIAQDLEPAAPEAPADARSDEPSDYERGRAAGITSVVDSITADPERWLPAVGAQVGAAPPLTDRLILDAATKEFPDWRIDIQEQFVLRVVRAVIAAMQHPSGGDQRTEGSGLSDRAQAEAVQRPVGGDRACRAALRRICEMCDFKRSNGTSEFHAAVSAARELLGEQP